MQVSRLSSYPLVGYIRRSDGRKVSGVIRTVVSSLLLVPAFIYTSTMDLGRGGGGSTSGQHSTTDQNNGSPTFNLHLRRT